MSALTPAELDILPIGSVIPVRVDAIPPGFIPFDGRTLNFEDYRALEAAISRLPSPAIEILLGWGAKPLSKTAQLQLPDIDSDTVTQMAFGATFENGPELTLAIKAERSLKDDGTSQVHSDDPAEGQLG